MLPFLVGTLFALSTMLCLIEETHIKSICVLWRHKSLLWDMWTIRKNVPTLNQTFLLLQKRLQNIPYSLDESPWDSYQDIRKNFKEKNIWPYLTRIDDTTQHQNSLSSADGSNSQPCLNFSSYSYLNAVKELEIRSNTVHKMVQGNYAFGNHGPRMLGGNNKWICELENKLARFVKRESAICFSSGFLACKSAIQAICTKEDGIFGDNRLHESIRDGIRAAKQKGCRSHIFKHNDWDHLEILLKKYRLECKKAYIVIESVYSMDGDISDLKKCQEIAQKYQAQIILDEAHGLGVLGKTGRGLEEEQDCVGAAWLIIGSFTKALGSVGGFVCGDEKIIDFLHFFAAGTMFSAPMSVPQAIAAYETLDAIEKHPEWVAESRKNIMTLTSLLKPLEAKYGIVVQSQPGSPLIAFIMRDFIPERTFQIAHQLRKQGIYVAVVNPPACPLREPRLRLTAPRGLSFEELQHLATCLDQACQSSEHIQSRELSDLAPFLHLVGL